MITKHQPDTISDSLRSPRNKRQAHHAVDEIDMQSIDRRDYFRLLDEISVDYKVIAPQFVQDSNPADAFELPPGFHLLRDLYRLDLEAQEIVRQVNDSDRNIGGFLHNLNSRLELLANILTASQMSGNTPSTCTISQGGVSFTSAEILPVDALVSLKLVFASTHLALTCFAMVRYSRLEGEGYRIGTQFINPDTTLEELITRYIVHKQAEERRQRLQQSPLE